MRFAVATTMRNEGAFAAEWIVWQRMIGFEGILVLSNDCDDRTPRLLDAFEGAGWITHVPYTPKPDRPPKQTAHPRMRRHPMTRETDWLMVCDVDEFLVIHEGGGTLADLIPQDAPFEGMAVHWRNFGYAPTWRWWPGLAHRQMTRAGPPQHPVDRSFKSIFRPTRFGSFGAHAPWRFDGEWAREGRGWVDSQLRPMDVDPDARPMHTHPSAITHRRAQINHYALRAKEHFLAKRGTPSSVAGVDRYTDDFVAMHDRVEMEDRSALRHAARFDALWEEAMALPGVARLHRLCEADHVARLMRNRGRDHKLDPRWRKRLRAAKAAGPGGPGRRAAVS